jgi:tRNA pseudouridine32 synthase/23S rRNA pseudouridine746 synthase
MARYRPNPPAAREGLNPSRVMVPAGAWATALDFFDWRFDKVARSDWIERFAAGDVVDEHGAVVRADSPLIAGQRLYYFRDVPDEPHIPFQERILYQDAHLLVADKPHFLPVIPSGKYVRETLLVRLSKTLNSSTLAPIHRIDCDTAGIVLFSLNPATRNAYAQLFREHAVSKTYHAIAPWNPELQWPIQRHTRIAVGQHFMQQAEVEGVPNALTTIRPLLQNDALALYELKPVNGQRHQLRVHMNALGLPILGDGIYPALTPEGSANFEKPLQLLAQSISFTDPLSGEARHFESTLKLSELPAILASSAMRNPASHESHPPELAPTKDSP